MATAKAAGKLRGGKPRLNKAQEKHLVELHRAGTHTTSELAELLGTAHPRPSTGPFTAPISTENRLGSQLAIRR